jgi:Calpain family cysteine protease
MTTSRLASRLSLAVAACLAMHAWAAPPSTLGDVLAGSFSRWDLNADGRISPEEVDELVVRPEFSGEQAAALAAMKLAMRSSRIEPMPVTAELAEHAKKTLSQPATPEATTKAKAASPAKASAAESRDEDRDAPPPTATTVRKKLDETETIKALQVRYARGVKRIGSSKRALFLDETPDIDHCRQGSLGDCFLIATVGAMVHRDPADLKRMIREADGGYIVTLGSSQSVKVPALTDAQLCLTSTTGDEGLWLPLIEQAFGTLRNQAKPASEQTEEASDAIARGGSIASAITTLTGHKASTTVLRSRFERLINGGQSTSALLEEVRGKLRDGVEHRRLMGAGTDSTDKGIKLPPGIAGKHAYAVLGFDASNDMVSVWNPHGNTFTPKGEAGLLHGYPTKAGRFEIPLVDFVATYRGLSIETDAETTAATKKPARGSGASTN